MSLDSCYSFLAVAQSAVEVLVAASLVGLHSYSAVAVGTDSVAADVVV